MDIIKIERTEGDFVQMYNAPFRDKSLSLKARGLLATIMSLPSSWDFSVRGLATILKEQRKAIYTAINELIGAGYCQREQTRSGNGFGDMVYTFFETPHSGFVYAQNVHAQKVHAQNGDAKYNISIDKDITDKDTSNTLSNSTRARAFEKPSLQDVAAYIIECGYDVDPQHWYNYYESNGWKVGRNPMKDWRACVRTWHAKNKGERRPQQTRQRESVMAHNLRNLDKNYGTKLYEQTYGNNADNQ